MVSELGSAAYVTPSDMSKCALLFMLLNLQLCLLTPNDVCHLISAGQGCGNEMKWRMVTLSRNDDEPL